MMKKKRKKKPIKEEASLKNLKLEALIEEWQHQTIFVYLLEESRKYYRPLEKEVRE
ncbi:unnamed protein product [Callosobruchus maculatus]|uniref:Uncharacterized protein n=1 Tax=Callosobruchus maculatus TaxID=64391 RepID=A0A653D2V7_CALMS|nr:unnamed protein product [Callosobruchus maculatus]